MSRRSNQFRTCSGKPKPQTCPYCGQPAALIENSAQLYRGKDYGPIYVCTPCDARVGCHPGTLVALGPLANAELRQARNAAHKAFDVLWKIKWSRTRDGASRSKAYAWLARELGIGQAQCHIAMFDLGQCARVVAICTPVLHQIRNNERTRRVA